MVLQTWPMTEKWPEEPYIAAHDVQNFSHNLFFGRFGMFNFLEKLNYRPTSKSFWQTNGPRSRNCFRLVTLISMTTGIRAPMINVTVRIKGSLPYDAM